MDTTKFLEHKKVKKCMGMTIKPLKLYKVSFLLAQMIS